jgi:hypothetical protein
MTRTFPKLLTLAGMLVLTCGLLAAAQIDGKWTAATEGGKGTQTLTLKATGSQLTGTIRGRRPPAAISDGTINGNNVAFKVLRVGKKGKPITQQFQGTVDRGQLKLKVSRNGRAMREAIFSKAQ